MKYRLIQYLILLITVCTLAACIHPIDKGIRQQVDPAVSFAAVSKNPAAFLDQQLVLGGVVLDLESSEESSTIELMEWRLNRWGEPTTLDDSGRRFLVKSAQRLDPLLYEPGLLVTLAGTVLGQEVRPLGGQKYSYPVLDLTAIHLWESPFRYGIHKYPGPGYPHYVGQDDDKRRHPYDPSYSTYPYTPYWYRDASQ